MTSIMASTDPTAAPANAAVSFATDVTVASLSSTMLTNNTQW